MDLAEIKTWLAAERHKAKSSLSFISPTTFAKMDWLITECERLQSEVADAERRGMLKALGFVEGWELGMFTSDDAKAFLVNQIREGIAAPPVPRECRWENIGTGSYQYVPSCGGRTVCGPVFGKFCPHCGETITIAEG